MPEFAGGACIAHHIDLYEEMVKKALTRGLPDEVCAWSYLTNGHI
jgi:hypothetical protein